MRKRERVKEELGRKEKKRREGDGKADLTTMERRERGHKAGMGVGRESLTVM